MNGNNNGRGSSHNLGITPELLRSVTLKKTTTNPTKTFAVNQSTLFSDQRAKLRPTVTQAPVPHPVNQSTLFSDQRAKLRPSVTQAPVPHPVNQSTLYSDQRAKLRASVTQAPVPHPVNAINPRAGVALKPVQKEQRFIVSPHNHTENFYNNTYGMSMFAMENNQNMIRPVFKDNSQREKFSQRVQSDLLTATNGTNRHKMLTQLNSWSGAKTAMYNFDSVDTKRSHPVVYTQGHGMPGRKSIESDDPYEAPATAKQMADQLISMNLPKVSEVRANSCYSGTQNFIPNNSQTRKEHQRQEIDIRRAGNWNETFAGDLQNHLDKRGGSHNRVRGYMGPTSQGSIMSQRLGVGSMLEHQKKPHMTASIGTEYQEDHGQQIELRRGDNKRYGKF